MIALHFHVLFVQKRRTTAALTILTSSIGAGLLVQHANANQCGTGTAPGATYH